MTPLPDDISPRDGRAMVLDAERRWARRCCLAAPLAAVTIAPLIAKHLLFLIYLQPVESSWNWNRWIHWTPFWLIVVLLVVGPLVWLLTLECELRSPWLRRTRLPVAGAAAVGLLIMAGLTLNHPRVRWFLAEWAQVRTEPASFARNTLHWEERVFDNAGDPASSQRVGLVGSSQVFSGFDERLLAASVPGTYVEKDCLAGLGPLQYPMLADRIVERDFSTIVCWLSEFDFFREDAVPVGRLRWCANPRGCRELGDVLLRADYPAHETGVRVIWDNRSELADLAFASCVPWWRNREHVRRAVFGYWWDVSRPPAAAPNTTGQLARSPDLELAKEFLQRGVGRKRLIDANFLAFVAFARRLKDTGVKLLVLEGRSHPEAMAVYDGAFRRQTRQRLAHMAVEVGFTYLSEQQMPQFDAADFGDAYHLNEQGRVNLTRFLAEVMGREGGCEVRGSRGQGRKAVASRIAPFASRVKKHRQHRAEPND